MAPHQLLSAKLSFFCKSSFSSVPKVDMGLGMQGIAAPSSSRHAAVFCVQRLVVSCHMSTMLKRCASMQKSRSLQSVCYLASGGSSSNRNLCASMELKATWQSSFPCHQQ